MIRLTIILCALSAITQPQAAGETLPGPIPADIVRVVDGDTIRVRAHIWLDQTIEVMVRLDGIDAPEIYRPECSAERAMAERAKNEVEAVIGDAVLLYNVQWGKYARRVVASAHLSNGVVLSDHLVEEGLAQEASSDRSWCGA